MGVGKQSSYQVDYEIGNAAMTTALNLENVFELVIDSFNERAPTQ